MTQSYVVGDSSPFLKRVLIPFWVIRVAVMVFEVILYAAAVAYTAANRDNLDHIDIDIDERTAGALIAILVVILLIVAGCLILDIVCIVKRSRRTLSPRFFLVANVIQTTVWLILFVLTMFGVSSPVAFAIAIVVFASFVGLLIYSSVIYHKFRKGTLGGNNAPGTNPSTPPKPYNTSYEHDETAGRQV
ncbi:hypothetical protein CH63R_03350 [Colletotrichum higginsianum IMI 349063]|uniref:Cys met metabolism pyridoxal phosphate-dependent enzyme n=2 Tax=Colletotrichum higginsianum (strain IMI 349063) TaxID=759273 RepID=A0A1B7YRP3_COLHI|nr:hypothetical protein CH63R_03350 [Colletotrichum higginsianum IMI 349063]OBR14624.1 hypothetical protein CH63R_03350 [Colletotrichum higginsianum IMI 349063]